MGTRFQALKEYEEYEFEEGEAPKSSYFALRMDAPKVRIRRYDTDDNWIDLPDLGSVFLEVPFMKINGYTCVLFMDKITARCVYFDNTAVSWCHEKDGQFIVRVGRYEFVGKQPVRYDDIRGIDM